jgi:hypothetical protein
MPACAATSGNCRNGAPSASDIGGDSPACAGKSPQSSPKSVRTTEGLFFLMKIWYRKLRRWYISPWWLLWPLLVLWPLLGWIGWAWMNHLVGWTTKPDGAIQRRWETSYVPLKRLSRLQSMLAGPIAILLCKERFDVCTILAREHRWGLEFRRYPPRWGSFHG